MAEMTRRSFFGVAAAAGAMAAMPAIASADEAAEGITVGTPVDAPANTEDADIVVVGSGIGGFFASMIAKEQAPDAVVVMLEKNATLGGSSN